jgi:hypothetical protein
MFATALKRFMEGNINLLTDDIRAVFMDDTDHTLTFAEEFLSDITIAALIGENGVTLTSDADVNTNTPSLGTKTTNVPANGVFDAADTVLAAVSGDQFENVLLFKWTGVKTTSPLIASIDNATGLPGTPGSGSITIQWDAGANRIFRFSVS